jgi:hypothetical protein
VASAAEKIAATSLIVAPDRFFAGLLRGAAQASEIDVYVPGAGLRPLLAADPMAPLEYGQLGTDGRDLVWLEVDGVVRPPAAVAARIMTAPIVAEPSALRPRRVRSELGPASGFYFTYAPFIVGCGYAARSNDQAIRIVRLSDGWSWLLPLKTYAGWDWLGRARSRARRSSLQPSSHHRMATLGSRASVASVGAASRAAAEATSELRPQARVATERRLRQLATMMRTRSS